MQAVRPGYLPLSLTFAIALLCSALPSAGEAYTPEQQQACSGDAFRLCSSEIPDVDRVTVCMVRNRTQLSPGCRVYFRSSEPDGEITRVSAGKPLSISPAPSRRPVSQKAKRRTRPADSE